jgi:hypothetical protein
MTVSRKHNQHWMIFILYEFITPNLIPPSDTVSMKTKNTESESLWTKAPVANLVRYEPSGIYFARAKVRGKLVRKSLDTNVLSVAKLRLADVLDTEHKAACFPCLYIMASSDCQPQSDGNDGSESNSNAGVGFVKQIIAWRIIYTLSGYGLSHVGIYIDPAQEPLHFARELIPRDMVLLGSQLTSVPPEFLFAVKPSLHPIIIALYAMFVVAALVAFLPWVFRDKVAAFWFAVMILAAIPEAVLVPLSKNFGFIAVGAYGLIASFVTGLFIRPNPLPEQRAYRILAWVACVLLILVHGPGAVAKRVAVVKAGASVFAWARGIPPDWSNIENENVIVVNHPCPLESAYVPAYKAYHHQLLPRTLRVLVPGCTSFDVQRTNDKTLVIQSQGSNIFSCDDVGPIHIAYAFSAFTLVGGEPKCKKGDRYNLGRFTVEILESGASDLPSRVAFHFDTSLDSPDFRWLWFDWRTSSSEPFKMPAIGQSVTLSGPHR